MATPASPSTTPAATAPVNGATASCPNPRVIVIDPGHGGDHDVSASSHNNAVSQHGALEKTLTLEYATTLEAKLLGPEAQAIYKAKGYCNVQVFLTRDGDTNPTGAERVAVATDHKADIFLSIHFNGNDKNRAFRQTETFYRDPANNYQTNETQDRELASVAGAAVNQGMRTFDPGAKVRAPVSDKSTGHASLWVLRDPGIGLSGKMCRSALIEIEYISNPTVETNLATGPQKAAHRDTLMEYLAKALAQAL